MDDLVSKLLISTIGFIVTNDRIPPKEVLQFHPGQSAAWLAPEQPYFGLLFVIPFYSQKEITMALKLSQKIGTTVVGVGMLVTGAFAGAAPAQAAVDPFPNAATCVVASDHVTVKLGSTGNSVKEAQCLLNRHGAKLVVDGKFGSGTDAAARSFQRSKGLAVDGVVGVNTWRALLGSTTSPTPDPGRQARVDKVLGYAKSKLGSRYVWGATGPTTFDCSGLTLRAYGTIGITTPRISGDQAARYTKVSKANAKPGDLMHWPGHVGIYAGNGKVYHASSSQGKVVLTNTWGTPTYHRVFN